MLTVPNDVVDLMCGLFHGREDAYGTDTGGCDRSESPLWFGRMKDHLEGRKPFGVYPVIDGNLVKWGCVDIDFEDAALARNLRRALTMLDIECWIERSRSKGFHCWVFVCTWIPAKTMRRALLAACQLIDYNPKEVNPKQEELDEKKPYGNYVRLPYPEAALHGRQVVLNGGFVPMSLADFAEAATLLINGPAALEDAAACYVVPEPPKPSIVIQEFTSDTQALVERLGRYNRYAQRILVEGPLEGKDRSGTLLQLAYSLAQGIGNFTPAETLALVRVADEAWGKFAGRRDCEEQLTKIITKAYGAQT